MNTVPLQMMKSRGIPILIVLSLLGAIASGVLYWRGAGPVGGTEAIRAAIDEFRSTARPHLVFERESLDAIREQADPATALPQAYRYDREELARLDRHALTCQGPEPRVSAALEKALLWHRHLCDRARVPLSEGFFDRPPRMHLSGTSYAKLALMAGLEAPASALHALELKEYPGAQVSPLLAVLGSFQPNELARIGEPLLVTGNWALIGFPGEPTQIFRGSDWNAFFETQRFQPDPSARRCEIRELGICWRSSSARHFRTAALALFGLSFVSLASALLLVLRRRARERRADEHERRFILQMLTHELRTPTTSLKLWTESLRADFDQFPPESQKAFLRMCDELGRLQQVTDASTRYLATDRAAGAAATVSLTELLRSVAEPLLPRGLALLVPADDLSIEADPYWLALCVRNLLENAFHHGLPPVELRAHADGAIIRISVTDAGVAPELSLREMLVPFRKGAKSRGLGLGLGLVEKITTQLGGRLEHSTQPTTFTLRFERRNA